MIWVELVCDDCNKQFDGTTIKRFKQSDYLAKAAKAGWKVHGSEHWCPLCFHSRVSGHRVYVAAGTCMEPGCRLNR